MRPSLSWQGLRRPPHESKPPLMVRAIDHVRRHGKIPAVVEQRVAELIRGSRLSYSQI